ncbi:ABC transporter ATP-binding protein [Donghicola tyrosinivorans]|uniref:ATP-binding cassette subfamily B protein n=1 Tax=Donghicola tyrosinivorans TaxID=1652492 RepID=A0A2T0WY62_9RHOB|nr:ABC transporter ATP-binding protein [Donghicola tyrosinivorans]PRY91636.1 ATP-binding cassette subfamily B protein [Donghicola tyrosinivorans]
MKISDWIDAFKPADGPPPQTLWPFMRWAMAGAWPAVLGAFALSALAGATEAGSAMVLGLLVDAAGTSVDVFDAGHMAVLVGAVAFFILLRPLTFGLSAAANSVIIQPNVNPLVLSRLNRWTLGQEVSFFDDDFAGRLAQKQMQCSRATTDVVSEFVNVIAFSLASLLGSVLLLGAISWWVALLLAAWLGAYFALIRYFIPRVRGRSKARASARAMVTGQVVDTITNVKTVKLFAHDRYEDSAALDAMRTFRDKALHMGHLAAAFRACLMLLAGVLPVLLIGATMMLMRGGQASAGDIAAAGAISIRIAQMTGWVSHTLMGMYANIGEIEDGIRTLTPARRIEDAEGAPDLAVPRGEIVFDDLRFGYGRRTGGVQGIDLRISGGEKIGIVGASGAGKSTLVSLLLRLYQPEGGRIVIDGQDISDVTQESLRRQIAMVTQDTSMFNRSARDNILYGRPDASEAELIAATEAAEALEFVGRLRDFAGREGFEAHLGERGVKLSGGQRQRIALARAILKDAPILVLDEATSALDSEVEAAIQTALERAMAGKTVLAIAHRLSTIARMDRIVVMDDGRVIEEGTHQALLAQDGVYARLWARQSGGFLGLEAAE